MARLNIPTEDNGLYKVVGGERCVGRIGKIKRTYSMDNCMFYPVEGEYPYRICLPLSYLKRIEVNENDNY